MNYNRQETGHTKDQAALLDEDSREAMQSMCAEYYQEGIKNGIESGREEWRMEVAKNLVLHNIDLKTISLVVNISPQLLIKFRSK